MRVFLLLAGLIFSLASHAGPADFVKISVPPGFEGPTAAPIGPTGYTKGYVRKIPGASSGTLLQITTYDFGSSLSNLPKEVLGDASEKYLMQFLAGIERQRTDFRAATPTRLKLGGIDASRVEWSGVANGRLLSGVMYCVIVGTVVVSFHTQGFRDAPATDRTDALEAIESVSFAGG